MNESPLKKVSSSKSPVLSGVFGGEEQQHLLNLF